MFTFLHAADIHLDSPLLKLEHYDGAPVEDLRQATRRALENLVELAVVESVDFVLIAGDLYDGDWKDYNTGLYFVSQMTRLREAGIPVYIIAGNHDAAIRVLQNRQCGRICRPDTLRLYQGALTSGCSIPVQQGAKVTNLMPPVRLRVCYQRIMTTGPWGMSIKKRCSTRTR